MSDFTIIKANSEDRLTKHQGVVGVGVGCKWVNGFPVEEQQAIIIFVEKKRSKRGIIQKFSANEIIPESIDGIPTDIIEVGKIVLHRVPKLTKHSAGFNQRIRPIKPGFSCGQRQITAGTIGGFFIDKDGDHVIVSNNHVLACENKAKIGDPIYQPGPMDASGNLDFKGWTEPVANLPYFATLKRFVPLVSSGNVTDSAIATINPKIIEAGLIDQHYPTINSPCIGFGKPNIGQSVQKCGRTTGYTTGRVIALNGTFTVSYDFGPATFIDCVVLSGMSKGGDSGSIIMDMEGKAVAQLFAGSPKVTIANPINYLLNEYGLQPWKTNPISNIGFSGNDWRQYTSGGKIEANNNDLTFTSHANQFCYIESSLGNFNSVEVTANTGNDVGATWGPGLTIQWPEGIIKVNLRYGDKFGGYFNGTYNINIGNVKPNTDYTLRIRRSTIGTYIGEIQDGGKWFTVIEIPTSIFQSRPTAIRIGKTDLIGQPSNHTEPGAVGSCTFKNYKKS